MKTIEVWKPTRFPFYEVSNHGRVRVQRRAVAHWRGGQRWIRGRLLPIEIRKGGYRTVRIKKERGSSITLVHHLLLEAFVGPRPPKQLGLHWDDNPANNSVANLRWGTVKQNSSDANRNNKVGRPSGEKNGFAKLTTSQVRAIRKAHSAGQTCKKLAAKFGVTKGAVWLIVKRQTWSHL
jgi:hypothetical protein